MISITLSYSVDLFLYIICLLILPILYFYFYIIGKLDTFPSLGEVALRGRCPVGPSSVLISGHQSSVLQGAPVWALLLPPRQPDWLPGPSKYGGCSNWWTELGHEKAGCTAPGSPGASACPLVGAVGS